MKKELWKWTECFQCQTWTNVCWIDLPNKSAQTGEVWQQCIMKTMQTIHDARHVMLSWQLDVIILEPVKTSDKVSLSLQILSTGVTDIEHSGTFLSNYTTPLTVNIIQLDEFYCLLWYFAYWITMRPVWYECFR